jgi:hypothetical protein
MNILFMLLKLIGILLLAVIALLLILVLTVLIVPIRYSVNVEHGSIIYADCRVNWLLHFINARISYIDNKLHIRIRLLFLTLYDNLKPKKNKDTNKRPGKVKKQKLQGVKNKTEVIKRAEADAKGAKQDNFSVNNIKHKENTKAVTDNKITRLSENNEFFDDAPDKSDSINISDSSDISGNAIASDNVNISADDINKEKNKSIFKKAAEVLRRFFDKIKAFFTGIRDKIMQLVTKTADIKTKLKLIKDFLQDGANREGFSLTYSKIKSLLKHILPCKLKSTIRFGTGDPCSTGQALGVISILYSFYGNNISITPDFENKVFEGKHYARGRISLMIIIVIVYRLLKDERFKRLKSNFLLLKEAL